MAVLLAAGTGCQPLRFYSQAVRGQVQIFRLQRPVDTVLQAPESPPLLRDRIARVQDLCRFATTNLNLPSDGHYREYADLGRPHVVWNVFAAPEFSLEAKRWWYPMIGRLKYQGYFQEAMAEDYARRLRKQGYDVFVGPVDAYSTLGWFHDPILNTWIDAPDAELAELVFHELTHQRLFISGDTDFNEAFATATAAIGVRRWFHALGRDAELASYEATLAREWEVSRAVVQAREELSALYKAMPPEIRENRSAVARLDPRLSEWRMRKEEILGRLRDRFPGRLESGLGNARLNQLDTYAGLVPAFQRIFENCGGLLEAYFKEVERIGRLPKERRIKALLQSEPGQGVLLSPALPSN